MAVEGKSLQHHPQVCTINVLEIMFGTRAYIEITSTVPFFKSITEVVSVKLQQDITFEKWYSGCNFCAFSERSGSKVRAHGKIDIQ
jgi:hypothetical protein